MGACCRKDLPALPRNPSPSPPPPESPMAEAHPIFHLPSRAELKRAGLISLITTVGCMLPTAAAMAQNINIDVGSGAGLTDRVIQLMGLLTVLSLAPSIVIMTTSFVRIV